MSEPTRLVKQLVDLRDQARCVRCGVDLRGRMASRHHRKLRSRCSGPELHSPSNLILLCGSGNTFCHGWVHAHPEQATQLGLMVHSWDNPAQVPVKTFRDGWIQLNNDGSYQEVTHE